MCERKDIILRVKSHNFFISCLLNRYTADLVNDLFGYYQLCYDTRTSNNDRALVY